MSEITVIIPVYNQAFSLALTLQGYTKQEPPYHEARIIVVDDGSTEPIEPIVESYKDRLNIKYIKLERSGRAVARNVGVDEAQSKHILFSDADRIPGTRFIQEHITAQEFTGGSIAIGQVRELYLSIAVQNREKIMSIYQEHRRTRIPQYCRLVYTLFNNEHGYACSSIPWIAALSGNMSLPFDLFTQLGKFDKKFIEWGFEHFEFGYRAYLQKIPFYYASKAVNVHIAHPRNNAKYTELIKKSHAYFYAKHPDFVVKKFLNFMLGQIGIVQLEHAVYSEKLPRRDDPSNFVRITNF